MLDKNILTLSAEKTTHKTWIAAIVASIVASLCCITPVFAFLAGISGVASTFSSLGKIRPYLIGLTILILGFAWYQKLKARTKEEMECETCEDKKTIFLAVEKVFRNSYCICNSDFSVSKLRLYFFSKATRKRSYCN